MDIAPVRMMGKICTFFSSAPGLLAGCIFLGLGLSAAHAQTWETTPAPAEVAALNARATEAETPAAAIRLHAQALRLAPSNGTALYGLSAALLAQNRPADALKVLRRLNRIFPDDPLALTALATALVRQPDLRRPALEEGLAAAEQAVVLAPNDPEAHHILSVLRHATGDYPAALDAARRALSLSKASPSPNPAAAAIYQQQENACLDALSVFSPLD